MTNSKLLIEAQLNTEVNSYLIECSEIMLEYELELEILTDAISLARRDLIHPKVLTPKELFDNLRETQYALNNKRLPVPLEPNKFTNLIDISDITIFYKDHRLIYIIKIPLTEQNDFILYHLIPSPTMQSVRGIYAFIQDMYI